MLTGLTFERYYLG